MAYRDDIQALNPNHHYPFDGDYNDDVGSVNGTNSGTILTDAGICEDTTNCMTTSGVTDTVTLAATADIEQELHRRAVGGWFTPTAIQQPPCMIYSENDTTRGLSIFLGFGNAVMFEVDEAAFTLQIYGDSSLIVDRPYHLMLIFESSTYGNKIEAYIDGVLQTNSSDITPGGAFTTSRTAARFGGLDSGLAIGGTAMKIVSAVDGQYNHWALWSGADVSALTTTIVREELFEKGATPTTIITNQGGLDALADTLRADSPLCIRVNVAGNISLTADNVTFDALASIHIEYTGTGTLTWTNTNGANASIGSTPGGGTITFVNPLELTLTNLQNPSEVRVYDAGTTIEITGQENVVAGTFVGTITVPTIDIRIVALDYKIVEFYNLTVTQDITIAIEQFFDRVYDNPA